MNKFGANLWTVDKGVDTLIGFCATADASDARGAMDAWINAGGTSDMLKPLKSVVDTKIEPASIALWERIAANLEQSETMIDHDELRSVLSSRTFSANELAVMPVSLRNLIPSR